MISFSKKIFFVLDISDVSEEASQWGKNNDDNRPIQINKTENKENKTNVNLKNSITKLISQLEKKKKKMPK